MRRSNGRAFAVPMASADPPLQIGCEVAGRRCAFEGWRRGPDVDHPIDQDFLDLGRANERALEERERAVKRTEPQGNGQDYFDN